MRLLRTLALMALIPLSSAAADAGFERDIRPILHERCYNCHAGARTMGGVRFDRKTGAFGNGLSGTATIRPGDPNASEIVRRVTATDPAKRMPLGQKPLSEAEIAAIKTWIQRGAAWPEDDVASDAKNGQRHWAYSPLAQVSPPPAKDWGHNPIDGFILAALQKKSLSPSRPAAWPVLIRRLAFDLTGLPPEPADVERFLNDSSPGATERLIDRFLASPHFGERWGRHWLDSARYADSEGYENDLDRPLAYRYRDFVIQASNEDMPFDQFARWQIAGDEYAPDDRRALIATGFLTAGPRVIISGVDSKENKERMMYDELDDIVSTTSQAFLGMTTGCARCHDHKYDPIPARDYYRMAAIFRNIDREIKPLSQAHWIYDRWLKRKQAQLREEKMEALHIPDDDRDLLRYPLRSNNSGQKAAYRDWDGKLKYTEEEFSAWLGEEGRAERMKLRQAVVEAEGRLGGTPEKATFFVDSSAQPVPSFLLMRGEVTRKQEPVQFGFLSVMLNGKSPEDYRKSVCRSGVDSTFRRSALAEWMLDTEHGAGALLARVIVNRLWFHHFGQGLVRTPDDFGVQGEAPSHPELLDWLARELIRSGWRLKHIHKLIVSSATYAEADEYNDSKARMDPENRLLWTRRPLRLEAEVLRDAILAVSGSLNPQMFGPPVRPFIPKTAMATRTLDPWPEVKDGPDSWRRSIYIFSKRSIRLPMLEAFDAPDPATTCGRRLTTTLATQALVLLNDGFVRNQATLFSERVKATAGPEAGPEIRTAYRFALAREPSAAELESGRKFLQSGGDPADALVDLCHVLFTLNEFTYVD
jgi:hypothetical protein